LSSVSILNPYILLSLLIASNRELGRPQFQSFNKLVDLASLSFNPYILLGMSIASECELWQPQFDSVYIVGYAFCFKPWGPAPFLFLHLVGTLNASNCEFGCAPLQSYFAGCAHYFKLLN